MKCVASFCVCALCLFIGCGGTTAPTLAGMKPPAAKFPSVDAMVGQWTVDDIRQNGREGGLLRVFVLERGDSRYEITASFSEPMPKEGDTVVITKVFRDEKQSLFHFRVDKVEVEK